MIRRAHTATRRRRRVSSPEPWITAIENGTDEGLFGPGSAVWAVNGAIPTTVAGIAALLIQTLHPGAMAGVHDHSRFREDAMGRLNGTIRWVASTTFGDTELARASANAVQRFHGGIVGDYTDSSGSRRAYSANDPELARWVHNAFTEAFLGAHRIWGRPIPGGPDRYVREWAKSGELMGVENPPTSRRELADQQAAFLPELRSDERVAAAVQFIRRPSVSPEIRRIYPILFAGAVASLPERYRRLLGLRRPWWPAVTATRVLLWGMTLVLGPTSPSECAAMERHARLAGGPRDSGGGSAPEYTGPQPTGETMPPASVEVPVERYPQNGHSRPEVRLSGRLDPQYA
jgi:uncharacterized protein (DUF2236 family)